MRDRASEIFRKIEEIKKQEGITYPITVIGASKMVDADTINLLPSLGINTVGENKVQELLEKYDKVFGLQWHFIGALQTNKVKYLIGKVDLYHSCDRDELAEEIARRSVNLGICSNVLIQINIGNEETKGGYAYNTAKETFAYLSQVEGLCVKGFMAMLPAAQEETTLRALTRKMRSLFEWAKTQSSEVEYLSMGMSGDYKLCIEEGSNVIRVGSTIFGARDYANK